MGPVECVCILLLHCHVALLVVGERTRPYFVSRNFQNVLHWDKVDNPGGGKVLYSVLYRSDDMPTFLLKASCQKITTLYCDLTAETPFLYDVYYYARVQSHIGPSGQTMKFSPMRDTDLGPPIVSVNPTPFSLHVTVTLPLASDNKTSIEAIFNSSGLASYNHSTLYTLNITHPSWAAQVKTITSGHFDISLKKDNTEYCGHVVYWPYLMRYRSPSENTSFCVTLPADPWMLYPWFLLAVGIPLLSVLTIPLCLCRYVKKSSRMPDSLTKTVKVHLEVPKPPTEIISIATPMVGFLFPDVDHNRRDLTLARPKTTSSYSSQDTMTQPWNPYMGQQRLAPLDPSTASSTSYGTLMVCSSGKDTKDIHLSAGEDRATATSPDRPRASGPSLGTGIVSPVLVPRGAPPMMVYQVQEQAPTGHGAVSDHGQLQLPNSHFQSEGFMESLMLPDAAAQLEGRPLLSDLLTIGDWEHSRCADRNTYSPCHCSYKSQTSPSQPLLPIPLPDCENSEDGDAVAEPGYKHNWLAVSPLGLMFHGNSYRPHYRKSHDPHCTDPNGGNEKVEDDAKDRQGEIHLGKWVVHIHG